MMCRSDSGKIDLRERPEKRLKSHGLYIDEAKETEI
jgi:hypothetical protein